MSPATHIQTVTVKAPVNIAVIKYWGKSDEQQILALNDSISGTLSIDQLCAKTSIATSPDFQKDRMWLNGEEKIIAENKRLIKCLQEIRRISPASFKNQCLHICSENNFPTAAGLASSAAGYACLVFALGQLLQVTDRKVLSILARQGSGSACRSVYGGFVQWLAGPTSETSYASAIVDELHWPQMRVIILVVNDAQKDTSSTSGMQLTVQTSELLQHRVKTILPQRVQTMASAIKRRDFETFAQITMQDSNQFHAVCQDTYPPIRYMNDISWSIVRLVHRFNDLHGRKRLAYTFDAGPNACIYLLEDAVDEFLSVVHQLFPTSCLNKYDGALGQIETIKQEKVVCEGDSCHKVVEEMVQLSYPDFDKNVNINNGYYRGLGHRKVPVDCVLQRISMQPQSDVLKGIISTRIGTGPLLANQESLLNSSNGLPLNK